MHDVEDAREVLENARGELVFANLERIQAARRGTRPLHLALGQLAVQAVDLDAFDPGRLGLDETGGVDAHPAHELRMTVVEPLLVEFDRRVLGVACQVVIGANEWEQAAGGQEHVYPGEFALVVEAGGKLIPERREHLGAGIVDLSCARVEVALRTAAEPFAQTVEHRARQHGRGILPRGAFVSLAHLLEMLLGLVAFHRDVIRI